MTDTAKLASVLVRLVACAAVVASLLGTLAQLVYLATAPEAMRTFVLRSASVSAVVWLLAGVLLFRASRPVGRWLARGLD